MILKSSSYQLSDESEYHLIKNKEAIKNIRQDLPDIIDNIGVNKQISSESKDDPKLIK